MSSEALEYAVENNVDPWATVVDKYRLEHPLIKWAAQGLLQKYWNGRGGLGETLSDVRKVANHLAENPVNRELLKRPDVVKWLNKAVFWAYHCAYNFAWP